MIEHLEPMPPAESLSTDDLKAVLRTLTDEEVDVWDRRRVLHAHIDAYRKELVDRLPSRRRGSDRRPRRRGRGQRQTRATQALATPRGRRCRAARTPVRAWTGPRWLGCAVSSDVGEPLGALEEARRLRERTLRGEGDLAVAVRAYERAYEMMAGSGDDDVRRRAVHGRVEQASLLEDRFEAAAVMCALVARHGRDSGATVRRELAGALLEWVNDASSSGGESEIGDLARLFEEQYREGVPAVFWSVVSTAWMAHAESCRAHGDLVAATRWYQLVWERFEAASETGVAFNVNFSLVGRAEAAKAEREFDVELRMAERLGTRVRGQEGDERARARRPLGQRTRVKARGPARRLSLRRSG